MRWYRVKCASHIHVYSPHIAHAVEQKWVLHELEKIFGSVHFPEDVHCPVCLVAGCVLKSLTSRSP